MLKGLLRYRSLVIACAILAVGSPSIGLAEDEPSKPSGEKAGDSSADSSKYYKLLRQFADTLDQVDRNYVKEIDRTELIEAAIEGMLSKLDQHSDYISPDEIEDFRGQVDNEFGGIGVQVSIEEGEVLVISPVYGSPAYRQGVISGDVITKVDGNSIKGVNLEEAVKQMKGKIGTNVVITVRHPDGEEADITIRRSIIRLETVLGDRRKDDDTWDFFIDREAKIGYIRLNAFSQFTARDLRNALNELYRDDVKGLILDLRFNPGGLLASAIQICDFFIPEGRIVSTEGRNTEPQIWDARRRGTFDSIPIAVLINRYSASASEVVSACLKDHDKAVVIGERSFGKGSVQNVINLEGGQSALKLTTAAYYRPSGKNIHRGQDSTEEDEWGVKPSEGYEVKMTQREMRQYLIDRQERDLLKEPDGDAKPFEDKQLQKAIEYIRGAIAMTSDESSEPDASEAKPKEESASDTEESSEDRSDKAGG